MRTPTTLPDDIRAVLDRHQHARRVPPGPRGTLTAMAPDAPGWTTCLCGGWESGTFDQHLSQAVRDALVPEGAPDDEYEV